MSVTLPLSRGGQGWTLAAVLISLPVLLPLVAVAASYFHVDVALWAHFAQYVLPDVALNTLWLLLGVGFGVAVLGTALAALVALTEFPGRRLFDWALLLPLAVPGYVMATAYIGLFDFSAPLATALRGYGFSLPEIRSRGGVIAALSLVLYPYVYLVARGAFASTGARAMEAARSLGNSPLQAFRHVALPLAAPWIAGGTVLALMETLADFGTVAAFNYDTFTTAIYKAWFALFSIDAALQLAGALLLTASLLLLLEAQVRHRRRYTTGNGAPHSPRVRLRRMAWPATLLCSAVLAAAFLLPLVQLGVWAARHLPEVDARLLRLALNSLSLALFAALLTITAALLLAYAVRIRSTPLTRWATRTATLGYAFPGPLLALGLFVPYAAFINTLNGATGMSFTVQGGLALMLLAYAVRFIAVAHAPLVNGLLRITPSIDEAARLTGAGSVERLRRIHLPLLSGSLGSAALLVFVDVMKEMPLTLMTRPFGWDTLAVRIFELTSEGEWQRAALPALAIVVAGLAPVWLLNRRRESP